MSRSDLQPTRRAAILAAGACALPAAAAAQAAAPPDWPGLRRYAEDDARLAASGARPDAVFIGDSITEGWFKPEFGFAAPGRVGRGISGQTAGQMLVRFEADVVALRPRVVHVMAGTNDVAENQGPETDAEIRGYLRAMAALARAEQIAVVLASIPPADRFPWRPALSPGPRIDALNAWLKAHAAATGAVYADYWSALRGEGLGMRPGLASDGVHPNVAGYAVMSPIAKRAVAAAHA